MDEDLSEFCCLNPQCPDHGKRETGKLTVCARYGKDKRKRMLYCRSCKYRFSERKGTPLFGSQLTQEKAGRNLRAPGRAQRRPRHRKAGEGEP